LREICSGGLETIRAMQTKNKVHVRIDNRLLHGQVVQFWIGHLGISHLVIADDETSENESMPIIYRMALPDNVELTIVPISELAAPLDKTKPSQTMVLIRDVDGARQVLKCRVPIECIVLGNIHSSQERTRVTDSVYLSEQEIESLVELKKRDIDIQIQTFPGEVLRLVVDEQGGQSWLRP